MSERAVTRAAGRIGLSQPAMSHALSRLRGLFTDELFVRTPDRMEPTARAREIAPLVSAAIEHIEAALNLGVGFDPAKSAGTFTAGMAEYAEVALVGRLAARFARQAAKATLRLTPLTGARSAEQLEQRGDRCRGRAFARIAGAYRNDGAAARPVCADRPPGPSDARRNRCRSKPMRRSITSSYRRAAIPAARSTAPLWISG